jgi:protein-tyrosine phosphatase
VNASDGSEPLRVVVVCLGNICRSPMGEAVLRRQVEAAGLDGRVLVESAGTGSWHVGGPADERAAATLARNGYPTAHTARQFDAADFARFDLVLAADRSNLHDLLDLARRADDPRAAAAKVHLLRSFDPDAPEGAEVPDPYYGGERGFDDVLDMLESAAHGVVEDLQRRLATGSTGGG